MAQGEMAAPFAAQDEQQREQAMARFAVLRAHLEDGVPLTRAANAAGIPGPDSKTLPDALPSEWHGRADTTHSPGCRHAQGWRVPSYSMVYAVIAALDPGMVTLALEGPAAFRDRFELIHRFRPEAPNAVWQTDHTLLDLHILDEGSKPARPWLTTVVDDHSRAIAGYTVSSTRRAC